MVIRCPYPGNFVVPPAVAKRRSQGVPSGGPCDPFLGEIVQHMSGNQTIIEISAPVTLTADRAATVAIAAPPESCILRSHQTFCIGLVHLEPGESLELQAPASGLRAYVTWSDLKSHSMLAQPISPEKVSETLILAIRILALDPRIVPAIKPQLRYIPTDQSLAKSWKTTHHISRIGTRLTGQTPDIAPLSRSEPSIHGAIQVTPGNEILIHGPDGPTLGGYPKAGEVISADLPTLAQLRPGTEIELIPVTFEQATDFRHQGQRELAEIKQQISLALKLTDFPP